MSKTNDIIAFPSTSGNVTELGMSLRDYLAAHTNGSHLVSNWSLPTIEKLVGEKQPEDPVEKFKWWLMAEAKLQYMKADAMLVERNNPDIDLIK